MSTITKTFSAVGSSNQFFLPPGQKLTREVTGTFNATLVFERTKNGGATWELLETFTASASAKEYDVPAIYRFRCTAYASLSPVGIIADVTDEAQVEWRNKEGVVVLKVTEEGIETPQLKGAEIDTPTGMLLYDPGAIATNNLRVASDVAEDETVTIGADVYEVEIVNTDSTDVTADDNFANTTNPLVLATFDTDYTAITIEVGGLIRIENEIMRCIADSGVSKTFERGVSGTTIASHADAEAIYVGDGIAGGSTIAVGLVTTLTPTAFTAALVDDINNNGTEAITAVLIGVNEILLKGDTVGALATATTETLAGANNGFRAVTMTGGRAQAVRKQVIQTRVPTAVEVALDHMHFQFDFTPTLVQVFVVVTATPGVAKAWDGAVTIAAGLVTIDNAGSTDWATTDTLLVIAQA